MPRQITVVTPENVRIDYELAGFASRAGAAIIDMLLQLLLYTFILFMKWQLGGLSSLPGSNWAYALLGIIGFLIFYGYFVYFETAWNGQTPGKRYCRLRTVKEGGLPVDLACAATRNLVRVIDIVPVIVPYVVGMLCVILSDKNKRLGDYAAGTLVVKERGEWTGDLQKHRLEEYSTPRHVGYIKNIELVTAADFEAAKRFVERMPELADDVRMQLAAKMARPMMARLGIEDNDHINYVILLSEIYKQCIEERGML